jgi:hypothetical protein
MDTTHIIIMLLLAYIVLKPCNCGATTTQRIRKEGFHGRRDIYGRTENVLYRDTY